jgi:hypothetical protein
MPGRVVLVLGLANLVADGFAMGAGNYSGTKADSDFYKHQLAVERKHIALAPMPRSGFVVEGRRRSYVWSCCSTL